MNSIVSKLLPQFYERTGPLTSDLLLEPGEFGLGKVPRRQKPDATTSMVCGYCSTGCGLNIHMRNGEAINLTPNTDYPVNLGMACPKGWEALTVLNSPNRATTPLFRNAKGKLVPVDWDRAMQEFCGRFKAIQAEHGKESVAFLSTGQIATEEMVFLGSLTKFGMGMLHGDGNTRQCMATAAVAYKQSFGFDAPPYSYEDFEESDVIVLIGSNLCLAHPIMWQRVCRNPNNPEIIVVDPRRTETAMCATQHLAINPKADLELLYGIANILIQSDWIDEDFIAQHTGGFDDFKAFVASYTPKHVAGVTGLSIDDLHHFAKTIHAGKRVSFWWTMGVNQSYQGVRTAQAIINLALMTGNIGRPGTGANSITGQCNAMGSRIFSNTTNLLGGRDFLNDSHRNKVADILGIGSDSIPSQNSLAYPDIIEGILRGKIKGLWVICTNPAHSWINQNTCRDILDRLDFLVVQDMYANTETAQRANLVLPAAGWGEKEGTFINSERRVGLIKKVAKAPGQALADFSIFKLIAQYWGCSEMFEDWNEPEDVFQTMKELSRDQPCDITGIRDYRMLDECGGIQWPFKSDKVPGREGDKVTERQGEKEMAHPIPPSPLHLVTASRLFTDGKFYHEDGRAKFLFEEPREMPEKPNASFPYLLLTGRGTASQWHTQTRTRNSATLRTLYPKDIYVEINTEDAARENIASNEWVTVESQRGRVRAKAFVTRTVRPGQVFIPMHYESANKLTHAHFDPYSKQPSYKDCAVRIRHPEPWDD
ncbi:MAG: molybdopterin-dependent oxidoreductase [Planctomycetaceae bacterium]|nr:molybdopterin-dependent oxidoreductase [Planctomycetaceae bacterium]MCB9937473.1 molybdopterin-dependent oxidoreductase [Planctomycetaceae bacterium]